uniref:Uncharacterized protein n=1 Tax=candidate division WOR-3 bacterium TaxID=2052148 RepID=A0A7C6A9H4_UNCW3
MRQLISVFLLFSIIFAHQPRLVLQKDLAFNYPLFIQNPEISQAFYGELTGSPHYYQINYEKDFNLYLNILVPDIKGARTDFSVEVSKGKELILNGKRFIWEKFFEPFGGDHYLKGPEYKAKVKKGEYLIKVYNDDNIGKYVLAVGDIESFPPKEMIKAFLALPRLKIFFNKSPFTAYFNRIGLYTLPALVIVGGSVFALKHIL